MLTVIVQINLAGARYMLVRTLDFHDEDSIETRYKTGDDYMKDIANTGPEWEGRGWICGG
jgi:hypothetical protein